MREQRAPEDFDDVLCLPEQPLIVGGQAVNIWADFYASFDACLESLRPFVSKDADIYGDRAMAERLAKASHWHLTCYYEPRTIGLAMLTKELPGKELLTIEVIGSVNGLSQSDLADPDILQLQSGKIYRLPSPIVLLKAKLANVAQIDQTRRQDVRHVKMLVPCVREYLRESHNESLAGRMTDRQLVNLFEAAYSLCKEPRNAELGRKHGFQLYELFPKELSRSSISKISKFFRFRLPELSKTQDSKDLVEGTSNSKSEDWTLDSLIFPPGIDKDREKSKEPEIDL